MNILDLKRELWALRGVRMPSESDGGNGNTGTSGATGAARGGSDSGGGGSSVGASGTSTSNYGSRQGFSRATSYGGGVSGGDGGSIGDGSDTVAGDANMPGEDPGRPTGDTGGTSPSTPAQTVAREMIARDVLGTATPSDPAAPDATDPAAPKTATQSLTAQIRSAVDPATPSPNWTGNRAERDARAAGNMAAGNADGAPAGHKDNGALGSGMYNATTSYADLKTMQERGMGDKDAPGTTSQTVNQALASQKVHGVLNATVPTLARAAVSAINPTFGLMWGAADAAANKNLPGFAGSAAGRYAASALGVPALGGLFGELGSSVATGKTPDLGKVAAGTLGGYIGSRVGQEVGQSAGPIAGTVAGSLAKNATNFGAAKALGR